MATSDDQKGVQSSFGKGVIWAGAIALLLALLVYGCMRASQDEGGAREGRLTRAAAIGA